MPKYRNKKITDFTSKTTLQFELNYQKIETIKSKQATKHPISPTTETEREAKQLCLSKSSKEVPDNSKMDKSTVEENPTLQEALGPLVKEFQLFKRICQHCT